MHHKDFSVAVHGSLEITSIKGEPFPPLSFRGTEGTKSLVPLCAPVAKRSGV
jgi:hypothetical protein